MNQMDKLWKWSLENLDFNSSSDINYSCDPVHYRLTFLDHVNLQVYEIWLSMYLKAFISKSDATMWTIIWNFKN